MRARDKKNLVKVGFFLVFLTTVVMIMVIMIGKESSLFKGKVDLKAVVTSAEKLKTGAAVELKGLRIGVVKSIEIVSQTDVEIIVEITEDQLPWIRQDTKISISNAGLVGDKFLELIGGSADSPAFNPNSDVLHSEPGLDFKAMAATGSEIAMTTDKVLKRVDALLSNLDGKKIAQTMDSMGRAAQNLDKFTTPLAQTGQKIDSSVAKLDAIMNRVQKGPGTAHALIYDDTLYENLRKLMGGAERNGVIKYFIRESIKKAPEEKSK